MEGHQHQPVASKSKLKRLNKKAKAARLEHQLILERNKRQAAEKSSTTWKVKALTYRKKYNEVELERIVKHHTPRQQHLLIASRNSLKTVSRTKATPAYTLPTNTLSKTAVPVIDSKALSPPTSDHHFCENDTHKKDFSVGSGRFGSCSKMIFRDTFEVCVKQLHADVPISAMYSEASVLLRLNSTTHTPYCFGVCPERRAIVMSLLTLSGKYVSLYAALLPSTEPIIMTPAHGIEILLQISEALACIHEKGFLHNDLKSDNIVLGNTNSQTVKAFIVDFGKACCLGHGKRYNLTAEDKEIYKREHTQIAPDLRNGEVIQCTETDIFALGRIVKKMNRLKINSSKLSDLSKRMMSYYSHDRPHMDEIIRVIHQ